MKQYLRTTGLGIVFTLSLSTAVASAETLAAIDAEIQINKTIKLIAAAWQPIISTKVLQQAGLTEKSIFCRQQASVNGSMNIVPAREIMTIFILLPVSRE